MHALRSLALALALSCAGCSIVAATRAPSLEQGGAACRNFVDDDLDGTLDCDDLECDGECPEETLAACTDGRDNDGDGVIDGVDARCWHVVPPEMTRCATVRGSVLEPPIDDGALIWRGVADAVPDPRNATRTVFAPTGAVFRVAPVATSTGALDGLRATFSLRISTDVETVVALVPEGELGDATTAAVFTRFVRLVIGRTIYLATDRSMGESLLAPVELRAPTWVDVEITIVGRTVRATFSGADALSVELPSIDLPSRLVDPVALDVLVQGSDATAEAPMLAGLRVERRSLPACDREELVPEVREDGFDLVLAAARGGLDGRTRCAISTENGVGRPHFAVGDDDWQTAPASLAGHDLVGAAFAWDGDRGAFVGVAAFGEDTIYGYEPTRFDRIESPDCVRWTSVPWALPEIDPSIQVSGRGTAYTIEADGDHVLRFIASRADDVGVLAFESEDGDPDTFFTSGDLSALGPETQALARNGANLGIELIGRDDLVLLSASSRGLVALTPRGNSGRLVELPTLLLELSDVPGTFDRGLMLGPPRFLPSSDAGAGRVFYAGTSFGNCFACVTSGTALFETGGEP